MDKAAIKEKVIDIIADKLGIEKETITPEAHVIDDLGADSLDVVELIMALEETFDIEIPDEDAEKIRTVQDIFDYIDKVVANAAYIRHHGAVENSFYGVVFLTLPGQIIITLLCYN